MTHQEIPALFHVKDGSFELSGTVSLPSNTPSTLCPGVLLLHGSGPVDRDGNVPSKMDAHYLRLLSQIWSEQLGCITLRYDKRGVGKSTAKGDKDVFYKAGMEDLLDDAVQAYIYLSKVQGVDSSKLVIVGHSETSMVMPRIIKKIQDLPDAPCPFGVVMLSGFAQTFDSALVYQRQQLKQEIKVAKGFKGAILRFVLSDDKLDKQAKHFRDQVESTDKDVLTQYFGLVKINAKWFREHLAYDPHTEYSLIKSHALVVTGVKDIQVDPALCDHAIAAKWLTQAASTMCKRPLYMSHLLRHQEGETSMLDLMSEYKRQGKMPLDPELVDILKEWAISIKLT